MANVVVGRTGELVVLERFLADPRTEPGVLLIEGEPGIGKTTLLSGLLASARDRGYPVLSCRPTRSEMDLSYVGLIELLGGVDDAVVGGLPAPQARVLRMIMRQEEPDGRFDRLSLYVAVVAAVRAVASAGPAVIAVDDAQWLDRPSATTIAFVVRRLAGTATRIVVARRSGEAADWLADVSRAAPDGRFGALDLEPIGPSELSRILRRALGWAPAWPRLLRIAELSGGNPLYALELARAFGGVRSGEELDGPLPDGVTELARSRIARLPDHVREVVETASVPRSPTFDLLRRLGPAGPEPGEALAVAERGGIVSLDGEQIRFSHPILAAAAYGSIPAARRRELHRAVAELSGDLEERARHLARATGDPDPDVAATLAAAAEQAWRRGAPDAAADLLRLACRRTPPADAETLALRRIAYGRLLHSAGDTPGAIAELDSLIAGLPPGLTRARAHFHQMYMTRLAGSLGRAVEHGLRAAADAATDPLVQAEAYELLSRISDNDIERKLDIARRADEATRHVDDPDPYVLFHARAALVEAEFYAGLGIHLERLDGLDAGTGPRFPPVRSAVGAEDLIGRLLTYAGRVDEGIAMLRRMYDRAAIESRPVLSAVLGWMAEGEIIAGRFAAALELTREAIERTEENGTAGGNPWELGFHGVALAMLGRLDEAETTAGRVVSMAAADPGVDLDEAPALLALGVAALARDRFEDAVKHLRLLERAKRTAGIREPRICAHASDLIEALVGAGELGEAADVLARFEAEAESSSSQWSLAASARCRALLLAAGGDLDAALSAAQRSMALCADLPMPFERARTLYVTGQIHRRRREKRLAREMLSGALDMFVELRTPVWAERARAELARVPLRQAPGGLTPTEEKIARLAAEGLTNREIADRAFLSPKTVEVNLTRIYRKLGVRSRAALVSRLVGPGGPGAT